MRTFDTPPSTPATAEPSSTFTVSVWHNTHPNGWLPIQGWQPTDPMVKVFAYPIPAADARNPERVLEQAFETFNVGEDELAAAYRRPGNRSLSVGDVVVIGEMPFACESRGWRPVEGQFTQTDAGVPGSVPWTP